MTHDRGLRIAFFADTHIGYSYTTRTDAKGRNLRVLDGYKAFSEIITGIIQENEISPIDAVVHGGDIFHVSHPTISDIIFVQAQLRRLYKHNIPFYGLAGNHDASDNRTEIPAVAAVNDPERGLHALWKPYQQYEIADGAMLHSVSHHGNHGENAVEVTSVPGAINILTTHGAALDPKNSTLLRCMDSPREQIIPPEMVLSDDFALRLLGHYHSRYPVGGVAMDTWYSGSTLRRGFSDEEGARGWLIVTLTDSDGVKVKAHDIIQRPQYDFDPIDASDMTPSEIQDAVIANLATTTDTLGANNAFDEANAPIIRQRIINATRSTREAVDRAYLAKQASHALQWQPEFIRPKPEKKIRADDDENQSETNDNAASLAKHKRGGGVMAIEESYLSWAPNSQTLRDLPPELRKHVGEEGSSLLNQAVSDYQDRIQN